MKISKSDRKFVGYSEDWKIFDYPTGDDLGFAYHELNGRAPEKGQTRNNVCDEQFYVISGTGTMVVDGESSEIAEGDLIIIDKGTAHYFTGKNLRIITITKPNWYEEQCDFLDE